MDSIFYLKAFTLFSLLYPGMSYITREPSKCDCNIRENLWTAYYPAFDTKSSHAVCDKIFFTNPSSSFLLHYGNPSVCERLCFDKKSCPPVGKYDYYQILYAYDEIEGGCTNYLHIRNQDRPKGTFSSRVECERICLNECHQTRPSNYQSVPVPPPMGWQKEYAGIKGR